MSYVRQMRDARGEQFRSSRVPFFGIHRGPTSRRAATLGHAQPSATTPQNEAVTGKPGHGLVDRCGSDEEGQLLHQPEPLPPRAQAERVARAGQRDQDQNERVDQVLIDDRVERAPHPRRDGRIHEAQHDDARDGREARANAEQERQADTQESQHEQPIHRGDGEGLEEGGQRLAGRRARQVALRGRAAVDPRARRARRIVQAKRLIHERPQENEADRDAQQGQDEARGLGGDDG